jgi:hypothetical protein
MYRNINIHILNLLRNRLSRDTCTVPFKTIKGTKFSRLKICGHTVHGAFEDLPLEVNFA